MDINIITISSDSKDNIWLTTGNIGLVKFNPNTKTFTSYLANKNKIEKPINTLFSLIIDKQDNIWVNGIYGLYFFDTLTESFSQYLNFDVPYYEVGRAPSKLRMVLHPNNHLFIPMQGFGI